MNVFDRARLERIATTKSGWWTFWLGLLSGVLYIVIVVLLALSNFNEFIVALSILPGVFVWTLITVPIVMFSARWLGHIGYRKEVLASKAANAKQLEELETMKFIQLSRYNRGKA